MIFITSYDSPDLDGVACTIAYAQLLEKQGKHVFPVYFGSLGLEVKYIWDYFHGLPIKQHRGSYPQDASFILVDTADPDAVDPKISPDKVVEIYDHRKLVFLDKFVNATTHIELVGSCATLITEKYVNAKIRPGKIVATSLYAAIISNTINFKNTVTTNRDKQAAEWLQKQAQTPPNFVKDMFRYKSNVTPSNLKEVLLQDFAVKSVKGRQVGMAQIEVVDLEKLIQDSKPRLLEILEELRTDHKLDYLLFSGIDILLGFNHFIVVDPQSGKLFARVLSLQFFSQETTTSSIIMRKQIWPLLENAINST